MIWILASSLLVFATGVLHDRRHRRTHQTIRFLSLVFLAITFALLLYAIFSGNAQPLIVFLSIFYGLFTGGLIFKGLKG